MTEYFLTVERFQVNETFPSTDLVYLVTNSKFTDTLNHFPSSNFKIDFDPGPDPDSSFEDNLSPNQGQDQRRKGTLPIRVFISLWFLSNTNLPRYRYLSRLLQHPVCSKLRLS